jgi:hypothetical protein
MCDGHARHGCNRTETSSRVCRAVAADARRDSARAELLRDSRPSAVSNACSAIAHNGACRKGPDCYRECSRSASDCTQNEAGRPFTSRSGLRHTVRRGPNLAPPQPGTGRPTFKSCMRILLRQVQDHLTPVSAASLSVAVVCRAVESGRAESRRSARCAAGAERSAGSR